MSQITELKVAARKELSDQKLDQWTQRLLQGTRWMEASGHQNLIHHLRADHRTVYLKIPGHCRIYLSSGRRNRFAYRLGENGWPRPYFRTKAWWSRRTESFDCLGQALLHAEKPWHGVRNFWHRIRSKTGKRK